ncbi:hypothetical protein BVC80_1227g25 [Macleaya cordata]|uniref:Uncharacterized protein n=1 Tax=Macleaya cordata TaxID=56857 RepID=A0A200QIQ2_MACCD|nr:hypothetical protein BVC80_1323g9 [Macleaya cordata]OVA10383.1 hypothetical protein BVC80_1001g7 [Macleaya cordata]OVA14370.1 hypothetical protein BVC80_8559g3 [Macleaya cordata]OVA18946.1 hypothetical protein BVC80_1227g25 [Macleaya cordata]
MKVTLDDSDSSSNTSDTSDEETEEMKAMTATLSQIFKNADTSSDHEESDEEIDPEELCANLLKKSLDLSKENKVLDGKLSFIQTERDEAMIKLQESSNKTMQLEEEISRLLIKINSLELDHEKALDEIKSLNSTLDVTKRDLVLSNNLLDKFNHGSNFISNLLNAAKTANDKKGLGYDAATCSNSPQGTKFVKAKEQHAQKILPKSTSTQASKNIGKAKDVFNEQRRANLLYQYKELQAKARNLSGEISKLTRSTQEGTN